MVQTDDPEDERAAEKPDANSSAQSVPSGPLTRREARALQRAASTRARGSQTSSSAQQGDAAPAKLTVVGVLGEVLITAGVAVMLFLGWYIWLDDIVSGSEQQVAAVEVQEQWQTEWERAEAVSERAPVDNGEPVVAAPAAAGEVFATLIVPRFGEDYVRKIAGGIDMNTVLNSRSIGVGHYPDTQMPGEIGNFAIAAHRNTYGGAFSDIDKLRVGDLLYVETADGWYEYAFRGLEYVWPTYVSVLEPVPREPEVEATDRFLTLTSCNPRYSSAERIIAYAVMENWYPRAGGPPAELSGLVEAAG